MDRFSFKLLSFLLSLIITLGVGSFFLLYFSEEKTKKIAIKGDKIDVFIQESKSKKVSTPVAKPKLLKSKKKAHQGSKSPKSSIHELKNLFHSLNARKISSKKLSATKSTNSPSRKRGKMAKELLQSLNLKNPQLEASKKMIKSVNGEQDPYLKKIYKILYENWTPSKLSGGSFAKVRITINRRGRLRYEILQLSSNEIFNKEFQGYLDFITTIHFPPPKKERSFVVKFEAKE